MGKLEKASVRIEWMRRNKGSVKWRHVTELLGWLGFRCEYIAGSHHVWVHQLLGGKEHPLELVRPHGKQTDDSVSRHDVKACVDAAEDVLYILEREV